MRVPHSRSLALLALTALAGAASPQETGPAPAAPGHAADLVDAYIEPYLATGNFSGSILVARGGSVLFEGGYGLADRETGRPNTPDTSFYLASTSRVFTSAAIMLLEQAGELSVSDPLSRFLPDWPRGDEITIHHLLTLSAGFPNVNELPGYVLWSREPQTPASLCGRFRDLPLEFPPGTLSVHSNSNYNVLALLIEEISGKSYGDFLQEELFEPLGMTRTAHDADSSVEVEHRAEGYRPVGLAELEPHGGIQWSVKTGNGSIYSTVRDLYRFDRMLVEGTILHEETVAKLFAEYYPDNGYGWFVGKRFGANEVSITGRSPGFGSSWRRLVEPDLTVVVLGNIYNGVPGTIAQDLLEIAMRQGMPMATISREAPDPELLAELVGDYRFGPDFYAANATVSLHAQQGHLFDGGSWLIPAGGTTFIHRTYWSTLTFERDEAGAVAQLRYDAYTGEKVR
jgi:CubicO group peptidase (beta-lactamase class C family)